jgi:hypothetical protein
MAMQTDVSSRYLNQTGFIIPEERSRIKAIAVKGGANAGQIDLFSTDAAPVAGTYGQSGNTITVTKVAHGLSTGQKIGIAYSAGTGGTAMCGNATITVTSADTFTIPCINSFTITGTPACRYVVDGKWLMTFTLAATDIFNNYFPLPGQGVLATKKVYASMNNVTAATVFYG